MKIIHITPTFFNSQIGGGERYPFELAKSLSKYHDVTLITFGNTNKYSCETLKIKVCAAFTTFSPIFSPHNPLPLSMSFFREIENADIVHVHQLNTTISTIVILYARYKGKPICVTDHAGGFKYLSLSQLASDSIDLFLPISEFSQELLTKNNKKKYHVIYAGVDTSKFYPSAKRMENNMILYAGKITPRKGIDVLIKAIQGLDVKLHVCGAFKETLIEKKYLRLLKKLDVQNKVTFNLNISDEMLVKEYSSALVTVLPSVKIDCYKKKYAMPELLGLVLLESMACETPVICSDCGGMPEIVENGKTGFIVPPGNIKSLSEKIIYFIENPDESKIMGEKARKMVLRKYTWDETAKRCMNAYNKLI